MKRVLSVVFLFYAIPLIAQWNQQNSGTTVELQDVHFEDTNIGWAVGGNDFFPQSSIILKTTNGGANWTAQTSPLTSQLNSVFFVSTSRGWAVGSGGKIIYTNDGGTNWSTQASGVGVDLFDVFFVSSLTGCAVGDDGKILITTDGGLIWQTKASGTTDPFYSVWFSDSNTGWAVGGSVAFGRSKIVKTINGGANWVSQNEPTGKMFYDVSFGDNQTGWAVAGDGVVINTANGGTNWIRQNSGTNTEWLYANYAVNGQIGWVGGGSGYIASTVNGGTTWTQQASGITQTIRGFYFLDATTGWAVGGGGKIIKYTSKNLVLTSPNGGESWEIGENKNITWTSSGITNVKIEYTTNNGTNWTTIIASTPAAAGTYSWSIPNTPTTQGLVRVSDASDATTSDVSNATFTIPAPSITVTYPNGGENLIIGTQTNITWTSTSVSTVKIDYSIDNGMNWQNIAQNIQAGNRIHTWTIPNTPSVYCLVRITDQNNSIVSDVSNNIFSIPKITLTSPNGGENIITGSHYNITWTSVGVTNVFLRYRTGEMAANTWINIGTESASKGFNDWSVPNQAAGNCIVQIMGDNNPSLIDVSDASFNIVQPTVIITSPNGGENWRVSWNYEIKWSANFNGLLTIKYSTNNGQSWNEIARNINTQLGTYNWTIPNSESNLALIKIESQSDLSISDQSNSTFNIISTPIAEFIFENQNVFCEEYVNVDASPSNHTNPNRLIRYYEWNFDYGMDLIPGSYNPDTIPFQVQEIGQKVQHRYNAVGQYRVVLRVTDNLGIKAFYMKKITVINRISFVKGSSSELKFVQNKSSQFPSDNFPIGQFKLSASCGGAVLSSVRMNLSGNLSQLNGTSPFRLYASNTNDIRTASPIGNDVTSIANSLIISELNDQIAYTRYYWLTADVGTNYDGKIRAIIDNDSKITIADNGQVSTISSFGELDANELELLSPNGGERWIAGSRQNITWTSINVANVMLEYSTDNGINWTLITSSTIAGSGTYSWIIPNEISINCKIRISNSADASVNDVSANIFTIYKKTIIITSPNGAENWQYRSDQNITWESSNVEFVKIWISLNNGGSWQTLNERIAAAVGTYSFNVTFTNGLSSYKIKISDVDDPTVNDVSDNSFTITFPELKINSPTGGEIYHAGTVINISWSSNINEFPVTYDELSLEYQIENSEITDWEVIAPHVPLGQGNYSWKIPNNLLGKYRVRAILMYNDPSIKTISNYFTISPELKIDLVIPNGGEVWYSGTTHEIKWTSNFSQNINLEYTIDDGASWTTIATNINSEVGNYSWLIPDITSEKMRVRVSSMNDPSLKDMSESLFKIIPLPTIRLVSPNGGESMFIEQNYDITWTSSGVEKVNIFYAFPVTLFTLEWRSIASNIPGHLGTYSWTVPRSTYQKIIKVKIVNSADSSIVDESDGFFTPTDFGIVTLSPKGGEKYFVGSQHNIVWNSSSIPNVKLYYSTDGKTISESNWTAINLNLPSPGSYQWTVPNIASNKCRIKIESRDQSVRVLSYNRDYFTIASLAITSPVHGDILAGKQENIISWSSSFIDNVKIEYTTNDGNTWIVIDEKYNAGINGNSIKWTTPAVISSNCRIRITDYDYPEIQVKSQNPFSITTSPIINILKPEIGEAWYIGDTHEISWTGINLNKVRIDFSSNNGGSWNLLKSAVQGNENKYSWVVDSKPSNHYHIKISDAEDQSNYEISNEFLVKEKPILQIISPGNNESLTTSTDYKIKWDTRNVTAVKLEYKIGLNDWVTIIDRYLAEVKEFDWITPDNATTQLQIKLTALDDPNFSVIQNSSLNAVKLVLRTPNGGENIVPGSKYFIRWQGSSIIKKINIQFTLDKGSTWSSIASNVDANLNSYEWIVPNQLSDRCLIKLSYSELSKRTGSVISNSVFSIKSRSLNNWYHIGNVADDKIYFVNENVGFVDAQSGLQKTTNGGKDWNYIYQIPIGQGSLRKSVFIDDQRGWISLSNKKLLHTNDGGDNWSILSQNTELQNLVFINDYLGYGYGDSYIWKTIDGGVTWTQLSHHSETNYLKDFVMVNANNGFIIFSEGVMNSYSRNKLLKTTDGGSTWDVIKMTDPYDTRVENKYMINVQFIDQRTGFVFYGDGSLLKTVDGGVNWSSVPSNISNLGEYAGAFFVSESEGWYMGHYNLYHTIDGGQSWLSDYYIGNLGGANGQIYGLSPTSLWANINGTVLKYGSHYIKLISPNGGERWKVGSTQQIKFECSQDLLNENISMSWILNDYTGFITATIPLRDGFYTWNVSDAPPKCKILIKYYKREGNLTTETLSDTSDGYIQFPVLNTNNRYIEIPLPFERCQDIWFGDSMNGYAVGENNVIKTSDGGANWNKKYHDYDHYIQGISFKDINTGWWYGSLFGDYIEGLFSTTTGGDNWNKKVTGLNNQDYPEQYHKMYFYNQNIGWLIGTGGSLVKTLDGGATWIGKAKSDHSYYEYFDITFTDDNNGWLIKGPYYLMKTTNGGNSWQGINIGFAHTGYKKIKFINSRVGFLYCKSEILKTIDGGNGWTKLNTPDELYNALFVDENIGYAACGTTTTKLYKTTNGGVNWLLHENNLPFKITNYFFLNPNVGWLVTDWYNLLFTDHGGNYSYSMKEAEESTIIELPKSYNLQQNYPNPFNPSTAIQYQIPFDSMVKLKIYNLLGEEVTTLVDQHQVAGYYNTSWNSGHLSSGVYLLRIEAESIEKKEKFNKLVKMLLVK